MPPQPLLLSQKAAAEETHSVEECWSPIQKRPAEGLQDAHGSCREFGIIVSCLGRWKNFGGCAPRAGARPAGTPQGLAGDCCGLRVADSKQKQGGFLLQSSGSCGHWAKPSPTKGTWALLPACLGFPLQP